MRIFLTLNCHVSVSSFWEIINKLTSVKSITIRECRGAGQLLVWVLVILSSALISSCTQIYHQQKFTFYDTLVTPYSGQLNLNGYFFCPDSGTKYFNYGVSGPCTYNASDSIRSIQIRTIIFYNNGRAFVNDRSVWGSVTEVDQKPTGTNSLDSAHGSFQRYLQFFERQDHSRHKSGIWNWGGYRTRGDSIHIQYFTNKAGYYTLIELKGIVESKNQFKLFTETEYIIQSEKTITWKIDREYKFYAYKTLPNSQNNYLNQLKTGLAK